MARYLFALALTAELLCGVSGILDGALALDAPSLNTLAFGSTVGGAALRLAAWMGPAV